MSLINRLFTFNPGDVIVSSQFNAEFNQIVGLLNGSSTDKQVVLVRNSNSDVLLTLNQQGTAPAFQILKTGDPDYKFRINENGKVLLRAGFGTTQPIAYVKPGGLFDIVTPGGSSVGSSETNLYTNTLVANFFSSDLDFIEIEAEGNISVTASTQRIKVYIQGGIAAFDSGATTMSNCCWQLRVKLSRLTSTSVQVRGEFRAHDISSNASTTSFTKLISQALGSKDWTTTALLQITGQDSTGAGTITCREIRVKKYSV